MNDYDRHIQRLKKAAYDDRPLRAADEGYAWLLFWILVVVIFLAMGVMFLVGRDHAPYLVAEKGAAGVAAIEAVVRHFDPARLLDSKNLLLSARDE